MSGLLLAAFLVLPAAAEEPPSSGLTDWVRKDVADFIGALPGAASELGSPNLSAGGGVGALDLPPPSWTRRPVPPGDPARSSGAPVVSAADGFFKLLPAQAAALASPDPNAAAPEPDPASLAPASPLPVPPADDARAADGTSRAAGEASGTAPALGESFRRGGRPAKGTKAPLARPKPFGAFGATPVAPSAIEPTPIRSGRE